MKITQKLNEIHIYIDFKKGAKLEDVGKYYTAYDTVKEHGDT